MAGRQAQSYRQQWEADAPKELEIIRHKLHRLVSQRYEPALYHAEARLMAWLCRQQWARQRYWAAKVTVVQAFLHATNLAMLNPTLRPAQVTQQALFCDAFFRPWRDRLLAWPPQQLAQLVTVHGEALWQSAYEQGKGVILLQNHTLAARLVFPWLSFKGVAPLFAIVLASAMAAKTGQTYSDETTPFLRAQQLLAAKSCLNAGGVVRVLPDTRQGEEGIPLPLFQRVRAFPVGFAELALHTGAVTMPVSAVLDLRGRVDITFHPPLNAGDENQSRSQRIEALAEQYVAFLHEAWLAAPGNINLWQMANFTTNGDYTTNSAHTTNEGNKDDVL